MEGKIGNKDFQTRKKEGDFDYEGVVEEMKMLKHGWVGKVMGRVNPVTRPDSPRFGPKCNLGRATWKYLHQTELDLVAMSGFSLDFETEFGFSDIQVRNQIIIYRPSLNSRAVAKLNFLFFCQKGKNDEKEMLFWRFEPREPAESKGPYVIMQCLIPQVK